VVIGGGLLGLEAAHGLCALNVEVTVVHRHPWLMNRQLDAAAGALLRRLLERRGIRFALGASPERIDSAQGRATGVRLDSGSHLPAEIVIFAAGIDPETTLAVAAGIPCRRAIVVDRTLATAAPGVYALGECCEVDGRTFGLVAPIWRQASVLADVLTGRATRGYRHVDAPTLLKVSGIDVYSAGPVAASCDGEDQVLYDEATGVYRRLVISRDRLVAAIMVGDRSGSSWYGDLIAAGDDVAALRQQLMFGPS
jgi:nitrite reductase (NADH) large subunit